MLATFDPRYELPSCKYFSKIGIPRLYNSVKSAVEKELKEMEFFSATTDLWSSEVMHPYISLTIHFVNQLWEMKNLCLQTVFLPCDHTGDNIAEALKEGVDSWSLKEEQLVYITTDNGSNVVCATTKLKWNRLSCFGHNLNLAVTKALQDDNQVSRALGIARKIVSSFSSSWKRKRELAKVQREKGLPHHSLINDCPTRWGSMEAMVSRLLEQEPAVRSVLGADRKTSHLIPTWQDIDVLESIAKALSPISDLTDFLSGENHVTVSSILPVLHNLKAKVLLPKEEDTTLTKDIKKSVLDDLPGRYESENQFLSLCTFLDPRFKMEYTCNKEELKEKVKESVLQLVQEENRAIEVSESHSTKSSTDPPPPKKRKLTVFLKKTSDSTTTDLSFEEKVKNEIDSYLSSPALDIESDITPLLWWKEHASTFPSLAKLTRKLFSVCATICASERLFSTSGNVVTPARSCLNPDKVNMLVFLAKNL